MREKVLLRVVGQAVVAAERPALRVRRIDSTVGRVTAKE
jgi:hypothetical protein